MLINSLNNDFRFSFRYHWDMENDILKSVEATLQGKGNRLARLLNSFSLIRCELGEKSWMGIYFYDEKENLLVLGPFQGSPACMEIKPGRGVVGTCYAAKRPLYVNDVKTFPSYISCDAAVKSEAVFPLMFNDQVIGVFDIDSAKIDGLKDDLTFLEQVARLISQLS
jgi:L-methionine (R)-S-oxide reductase